MDSIESRRQQRSALAALAFAEQAPLEREHSEPLRVQIPPRLQRRGAMQFDQEVLSPRRDAEQAVTQIIVVTCGPVRAKRQMDLGKRFKRIIQYNPALHKSNVNLESMNFDCLLVDASDRRCHRFLEVVKGQAADLGIPIIMKKKRMSNIKVLAAAVGAFVIASFDELLGADFMDHLVLQKIPKLVGFWASVLQKLFH